MHYLSLGTLLLVTWCYIRVTTFENACRFIHDKIAIPRSFCKNRLGNFFHCDNVNYVIVFER